LPHHRLVKANASISAAQQRRPTGAVAHYPITGFLDISMNFNYIGFRYRIQETMREVEREILLSFWKVHILHA